MQAVCYILYAQCTHHPSLPVLCRSLAQFPWLNSAEPAFYLCHKYPFKLAWWFLS